MTQLTKMAIIFVLRKLLLFDLKMCVFFHNTFFDPQIYQFLKFERGKTKTIILFLPILIGIGQIVSQYFFVSR